MGEPVTFIILSIMYIIGITFETPVCSTEDHRYNPTFEINQEECNNHAINQLSTTTTTYSNN